MWPRTLNVHDQNDLGYYEEEKEKASSSSVSLDMKPPYRIEVAEKS